MKQRPRIYYTESQKALMWERWKDGWTLHEIGHLLVAWSHRHVESWLSALLTQCSPVVAAITASWCSRCGSSASTSPRAWSRAGRRAWIDRWAFARAAIEPHRRLPGPPMARRSCSFRAARPAQGRLLMNLKSAAGFVLAAAFAVAGPAAADEGMWTFDNVPIDTIKTRYGATLVTGGTMFEELGFYYVGPIDGHNLDHLLPVLKNVRDMETGPILVHVVTQKGKGYAPAEAADDKYHGVAKFDVITGEQAKGTAGPPSYTGVFAQALLAEVLPFLA